MRGWTEQRGVIARHGRTTFRCDADLCRAYVGVSEGDDRREQHDREFHLLRLESNGGGEMGYDMHLDGKYVGDVKVKRETWNLIRLVVSETWVARVGNKSVGGYARLSETMHDVLAETGAKAWGKGKNPKVWHYPKSAP